MSAGATGQVTAQWEWEGGVFDPGNSNVDGSFDVTIADVVCLRGPGCGQPPVPAPAPGTPILLGLGLLSLMVSAVSGRRARGEGTTA